MNMRLNILTLDKFVCHATLVGGFPRAAYFQNELIAIGIRRST